MVGSCRIIKGKVEGGTGVMSAFLPFVVVRRFRSFSRGWLGFLCGNGGWWGSGDRETLLEDADGVGQLVPTGIELQQGLFAFFGQGIILSGRPLRAFLPFVFQPSVFFQTVQQGVERAFHHYHFRLLEMRDDVVGVGRPVSEQKEYAIFEHPLAHLGFGVVNIGHRVEVRFYPWNSSFVFSPSQNEQVLFGLFAERKRWFGYSCDVPPWALAPFMALGTDFCGAKVGNNWYIAMHSTVNFAKFADFMKIPLHFAI